MKTYDPAIRISKRDLGILISTLEVQFVWLSHCMVSPGFRLEMGGMDFPGIHFNISGNGRLLVTGQEPIDLEPNTLVVVPPNSPFKIEVRDELRTSSDLQTVSWINVVKKKSQIYQFVAGDPGEAGINLVCGFFLASYGQTTNLFEGLHAPIVEKFGTEEHIGARLQSAVSEFLSHDIGSDAISASLLKQVIILLIRRSLMSVSLWTERFKILCDPGISRVFAAMTADPGSDHTVKSLAEIALMSRSTFMSAFTGIMGKSPMATLRDLRMQHGTQLLKYSYLSIDQVSRDCGYDSKSSFTRAFWKAYGKNPAEYRAGFLSDVTESP